MKAKKNKIKISKTDIESFNIKEMTIDPYWIDLYNPQKCKKSKIK